MTGTTARLCCVRTALPRPSFHLAATPQPHSRSLPPLLEDFEFSEAGAELEKWSPTKSVAGPGCVPPGGCVSFYKAEELKRPYAKRFTEPDSPGVIYREVWSLFRVFASSVRACRACVRACMRACVHACMLDSGGDVCPVHRG